MSTYTHTCTLSPFAGGCSYFSATQTKSMKCLPKVASLFSTKENNSANQNMNHHRWGIEKKIRMARLCFSSTINAWLWSTVFFLFLAFIPVHTHVREKSMNSKKHPIKMYTKKTYKKMSKTRFSVHVPIHSYSRLFWLFCFFHHYHHHRHHKYEIVVLGWFH